jgi:hypothetical protein
MEKLSRKFIFLCTLLFALAATHARAAQIHHRVKTHKHYNHRGTVKLSRRAQMQLKQAHLHEQQAKEVEQVQKALKKQQPPPHQ